MDEFFLIAEIKATQGTKGYVLIESFSDFSERFFQLKKVFVEIFGNFKELVVDDVTNIKGSFAFKFSGFNSSDDANVLINKKIYVDKGNRVHLDKDTFFVHDVVGSKVFKDSVFIGNVADVYTLPANDVYLVRDPENREILIPAVKDYVESFDPVEKIMILVPGTDLLYNDEN